MAIHIPEDKLSEIRNTANIVDIISERVVLKKAGKDHVGLCPFHSEKTPSFTVSSVKQIFHCFGCGAGGDVFSFLMKHDGIGFVEAINVLAKRYGIALPDKQMTAAQKKSVSQRQQLFELNRKIMQYYTEQLNLPSGRPAQEYLKQRGFCQEIISQFSLGFAPDGWEYLVRYFKTLHISQGLAKQTGMVVPRANSGFYDLFRKRIIFPILDLTRQVIGFGGRVMDDAKPKYLNSPETPVYNKSKSLYGAPAARSKARETGNIYIVEGYFDLLALHQHGIRNSVATLGTSLTADHVRQLTRGFAKKAFLVFDSDAAGLKAARRSIPLFMNAAMDAAVIVLPRGYDPDSFVFEFGPEAFEKASENAIEMIEFLIESAIKAHGLSMEGKIRVIADLQQPLAEIEDSVARSIYIRYLSERLNVDEAAIMKKISLSENQYTRSDPGREGRFMQDVSRPSVEQSNAWVESEMSKIEKKIISMMLHSHEILPEIEKRRVLDYFSDHRLTAIGKLVLKYPVYGNEDVSALMSHMESADLKNIAAELFIADECRDLNNCEQLLAQFMNAVERRQNDLLTQIQSAQASNDESLLFELLRKKQEQLRNR